MKIVVEGDQIILRVGDEGILYSVTGSLISPFEMIKTLSQKELDEITESNYETE